MDKLKEFLRWFFIILGAMAFVSILGLAGDSDLHNIEFNQILVRGVPALILLVVCFVGQAMLGSDEDGI